MTLGGPCPLDELTGVFKLESSVQDQYTLFDATVKNGLEAAQKPEVVLDDGDCQLLRRRHLVCDPPCPSRQSCGLDETCEPMPLGQDLGTVYVAGLDEVLALEPLVPGYKYFASELPQSPLDTGSLVRVRTTTGYLGEVQLFGFGVAPLVIPSSAMTWLLREHEPLEIRWNPPSDSSQARINLQLTVDQHGFTPVRLSCDVPDTGSAIISEALVDAVLAAGISGFPNGSMTRLTVDSTTSPDGCVEFRSSSISIVNVRVSGHTPCVTQSDCPSGTTCDTVMQQCG